MCRWALVWTGDPDEAEDVAQQVLIRVDRSIGDFVARGRVTTWVYRITQNVLRDRERRVRREDRDRKKLELWALETAGHSTGADDDTRWVITLLGPDGFLVAHIAVPLDVDPTHIGRDFLLGRWRGDLDVEHVLLYELVKP